MRRSANRVGKVVDPGPTGDFVNYFANDDRIFAYSGQYEWDANTLRVTGLCISCTGWGPDVGNVLNGYQEILTEQSWTAGDHSDTWKQGPTTLQIIETSDMVGHVILSFGELDELVMTRHFRQLSKQLRLELTAESVGALSSDDPSTEPPRGVPRDVAHDELCELVRAASQVVVLSGAGISQASGIRPFLGIGSLSEYFPLNDDFPGAALEWMVYRPLEMVDVLVRFEEALRSSRPNAGHEALVHLEQAAVVAATLTSNYDGLHAIAGSVKTHNVDAAFGDPEIWTPLATDRAVLLVVGVSLDEYGIVRAARQAGFTIVACDTELPRYLGGGDRILIAPAETALTGLAGELLTPNTSRAHRPSRASSSMERNWFHGLIQAVEDGCPGSLIANHGPPHWRNVAWTGLNLARPSQDIDPLVVLLFGMLHDSMRVQDSADPLHGPRAAFLADLWSTSLLPTLSYTQSRLLALALAHHTEGIVTRNPTVGTCWDADRLDLWRVGVAPNRKLLSTAGARSSPLVQACDVTATPTWNSIWDLFLEIENSRIG
jgi:uncharacterized protein